MTLIADEKNIMRDIEPKTVACKSNIGLDDSRYKKSHTAKNCQRIDWPLSAIMPGNQVMFPNKILLYLEYLKKDALLTATYRSPAIYLVKMSKLDRIVKQCTSL